jgi:hypothetical protein
VVSDFSNPFRGIRFEVTATRLCFFSKPNRLWILIELGRAEGGWEDKIESLYAAVSLQAQAVFNKFLTMSFASVQRFGSRSSLAMEYAH